LNNFLTITSPAVFCCIFSTR